MNWANVGRSAARRVWAPGLCWAALWKQKDAASIGARDGTWALGSGCAGETPCEHGCGSGPSEAQAARSAAATGARKRDALVGVRSAAAAAGMGRRARCAKRGLGTVRDACKGRSCVRLAQREARARARTAAWSRSRWGARIKTRGGVEVGMALGHCQGHTSGGKLLSSAGAFQARARTFALVCPCEHQRSRTISRAA